MTTTKAMVTYLIWYNPQKVMRSSHVYCRVFNSVVRLKVTFLPEMISLLHGTQDPTWLALTCLVLHSHQLPCPDPEEEEGTLTIQHLLPTFSRSSCVSVDFALLLGFPLNKAYTPVLKK